MSDTFNALKDSFKEPVILDKFTVDAVEDKINDEFADKLEDFFFRNGKLDDLNFFSFIKNCEQLF
ncbi:MAG: hypothetical protein GX278_02965 [Aeromonadales bacterium]|nr:hypothetical protein [Aeromonadales bacterium]